MQKWIPKKNPITNASLNTSIPSPMTRKKTSQVLTPRPEKPKIQVWQRKSQPPNASQSLIEFKEDKPKVMTKQAVEQPLISKASSSQSTIIWRSQLLQALLQHRLPQYMVIQKFSMDNHRVSPIPY